MKDCSKIHPLLSRYHEHALSKGDMGRVERHLSVCPDANHELKQLELLSATLNQFPEPKMPKHLHGQIMDRLHRKPKKSVKPWAMGGLGLAAAACIGFFFILGPGGNLLNQHFEPALKPANPAPVLKKKSLQQPKAEMALAPKAAAAPQAKVEMALKPQSIPAQAPQPVAAMAPAPAPRAMAKAAPRIRSFQGNEALAPATNMASAPAPLVHQSFVTQSAKDQPSPLPTSLLRFTKFTVVKAGPGSYELDWGTNLMSKGQLTLLDAKHNVLGTTRQNKPYEKKHQLTIDTSKISGGFYVKLRAYDANGDQAITQSGLLQP